MKLQSSKLLSCWTRRALPALLLASLATLTHAAVSRPTVIDGSFNPDPSALAVYSLCFALQNDGKVLLGGQSNDNRPVSRISRLNTDGTLDNSFKLDSAFNST